MGDPFLRGRQIFVVDLASALHHLSVGLPCPLLMLPLCFLCSGCMCHGALITSLSVVVQGLVLWEITLDTPSKSK